MATPFLLGSLLPQVPRVGKKIQPCFSGTEANFPFLASSDRCHLSPDGSFPSGWPGESHKVLLEPKPIWLNGKQAEVWEVS